MPRASIVGGNLTLLQGSFAVDGGATVYRVTLMDDAGSPQLDLQREWTHPDAYVALASLNVASADGSRALHAYDGDPATGGRPYAGVVLADGTFDVAVGEHALPNGTRYLFTARPVSTGFQIAGTDYGTTERIRLATVDAQLNVVTESFHTPKLPYRTVHSMFDEPGHPGPTVVLTSHEPPHLVLWRPPYDNDSWSDWYTEFSVAPFTDRREGHAAVHLDPPLAVVASYTSAGDAGEPLPHDAGSDAGAFSSDAGNDGGVVDGGTSQDLYTYPGCEDAGSYGCPNLLVFNCALRDIEARHNDCATPSDCVAVPVANCVGVLSSCPPAAVSDAGRENFLRQATHEVWSYCGDGGATCVSAGSCAASYRLGRTACVNGHCVAVSDDAGT